eukprot:c44135_g1_i1 orf=47-211(+)
MVSDLAMQDLGELVGSSYRSVVIGKVEFEEVIPLHWLCRSDLLDDESCWQGQFT